ncbi:MAG: transposase [Bacteroidales bacterium]|nr:transposase [Bacteroidales bacterium]
MRGRISFKQGAIQHIYQNTVGGVLIFYSGWDALVFFTTFSTAARRYDVRILGLCLMVDHIHVLVDARSKKELDAFVCLYTSWFVRQYNVWYGLKGSLFNRKYGLASKVSDKDIISAIAYLYNNPVERQLCVRAERSKKSVSVGSRSVR